MTAKRGGRRAARSSGAHAPAERISKPERLLNLVAFLLSTHEPVPFSKIKGRVAGYDDDASPEALEKRFDRDKAELRGLGVPIVYDSAGEADGEGYRIPRDQYFLPDIRLDLEEAAALAVVQQYAETAAGDPLATPLKSALRKILVDSPMTTAAMASVTEQHRLGVRTRKGPPDLAANLSSLTDAVVRRQAVRFRYWSIERDEIAERDVAPYGIGWHGQSWYLVGHDRGRGDVRQFRVDRVRGRVRVRAGKPFDVPDDFDISEYVGKPAFAFRKTEPAFRARIQLSPEIAFMVREGLRPDWSFEELPDGGAVLSFEGRDGGAALRYVAQHAERARVLSPATLRDRACDHFRAILARHEGAPSVVPPRSRGGRRKR